MSDTTELKKDILDTLTTTIGSYFTQKGMQETQNDMNIANFLFQNEYKMQQQNKDRLNTLGIKLPEHLQTSNYASFVENSGDTDAISALGQLYAEAEFNNMEYNKLINQYSGGLELAKSLINEGRTASGDETRFDEGYYQFSGPEIEGLKEEYPELNNAAYLQGFKAGNVDLTTALTRVQKVNEIYAMQRAIREKDLASADAQYLKLSQDTGRDIITNVSAILGAPIMNWGGAYAQSNEELRENIIAQIGIFSEENLTKNFPNIKGEIESAINTYASHDADASVFQQLSAKAYSLKMTNVGKEQKYAVDNKVTIDIAKEQLLSLDSEYARNETLLKEYGDAGLILDSRTMQEAYLIETMGDKIKEGRLVIGEESFERFDEIDMKLFEELQAEYTPIEGLEESLDNIENIRNIWNATGDMEDSGLKLEGDEALIKLAGEIESQQTLQTEAQDNFRVAARAFKDGTRFEYGSSSELFGDTDYLSLTDTGGWLFDKLPDEDRMYEIKTQVQTVINNVKQSQPITEISPFYSEQDVAMDKAKKIAHILKLWNNYQTAWKAAAKEQGKLTDLNINLDLN